MANAVTIHLIRHEQTKANVEKRYIGRTDQSILHVNPRIMTHQPAIVYGSALKRCKETAQLYFPNADYKRFTGFNELDFGEFEMKTYEDLKDNTLYRKWIDNPLFVTPPNGESFQQFKERVYQTFQQIVQDAGAYTFVVHGGVIRVLLAHFLSNIQTFSDVHAAHHTQYTLTWTTLQDVKEGKCCTSYSEVYLMEKDNTSKSN